MPLSTAEYTCFICHLSFTPQPSVGGGYLPCHGCNGAIVDVIDCPWNEMEVQLGWGNPRRRLDSLSEDDPHLNRDDGNLRPRRRRANAGADPTAAADLAAGAATATGSETNLIREYLCPYCHLSFTPLPPVGGGYLSCPHCHREFVHELEAGRPLVNPRRQLDSLSEDDHSDREGSIRPHLRRANGGAEPAAAAALDVGILSFVTALILGGFALYDLQKRSSKAVHFGCYAILSSAVVTLVHLIGGFCYRSPKMIWAGRVIWVIDVMMLLAVAFMSLA